MSIAQNILELKESLPKGVELVAVTKTHPLKLLQEAYAAGQKQFGENRVQEMGEKQTLLPKDIRWHLIGHLQTNKVREVASYISLIHSVDSIRLLEEINKQALKNGRTIDCLLQIFIASEETKFGLEIREAEALLHSGVFGLLKNIRVRGLMGMATNTPDTHLVRKEFASLRAFFESLKKEPSTPNFQPDILSMGMSSDYRIAISEGSTLIRVGSAIFGQR
ncbi:MAG TPA: YggS family pyridoxal phosphate-dependent enzyme [Bacteroidia bacterium]|nr:YggS family pyridoxal phosphate-dependent enzyme [Bacteroidia bacterium]